MLNFIKKEFRFKNLISYSCALVTAFLISVVMYSSNAFADLQGIFYPDSFPSTYEVINSGSNYSGLTYRYWRSESVQGNSNTPTTVYFSQVRTSSGTSSPSGAQFGVYKIVDLRDKRYLDWYAQSITTTKSVPTNYTANMGSLYSEMTVYADSYGIDGSQSNVRYDRIAYTNR
ncbi:hypothetical protein [Paenibacillus sp. sgz500958]|uniref:hypothetical protein n=1 Tax=Paenibacillus sp. sgz500958 TaxID=3242475 RepID=UPI0036D27A26